MTGISVPTLTVFGHTVRSESGGRYYILNQACKLYAEARVNGEQRDSPSDGNESHLQLCS